MTMFKSIITKIFAIQFGIKVFAYIIFCNYLYIIRIEIEFNLFKVSIYFEKMIYKLNLHFHFIQLNKMMILFRAIPLFLT